VLLAVVALAALAGLAYWLVVVTEGAYLGRRAVRWLYDHGAATYDDVKQYRADEERAFLGVPVFERLDETVGPAPLVLDVATGTGRLPLALLALPAFAGRVVGVDHARGMLREAAAKTRPDADHVHLVQHPAVPLPFADETFDGVAMIEAREFLPDRWAAVREMVRVLRPGGTFVTTNRIGLYARLMPGRADRPADLERRLAELGLVEVVTYPWETEYDLLFARKAGTLPRRDGPPPPWHTTLVCPACGACGDWAVDVRRLACRRCGRALEADGDGVWGLA
jgi:ubiquinone/menaquinone biosynthesis C-methylase UbiE